MIWQLISITTKKYYWILNLILLHFFLKYQNIFGSDDNHMDQDARTVG